MMVDTTTSPVTISIVGTGSGSGGGVAPTPNGTIAVTPGAQPDLKIKVIGPFIAIGVRAANAFLMAYLAQTALGVPAKTAAWFALGIAGTESIKNAITVFGRLEGKYPLLTGSI